MGISNIIKLMYAIKNKSNTQNNKLQNPAFIRALIDSIDIIDNKVVIIVFFVFRSG